MGSGWGLAVSSLSARQAVMEGRRAKDETLVPKKDVRVREPPLGCSGLGLDLRKPKVC